jgi:hypothetical protein
VIGTAGARARTALLVAGLAGGAALTGCGTGGRRPPPPADSTRFGDDRATQGDSARRAPEVVLLERLVDRFEVLDVVMDELGAPSSSATVQHRAWSGDRHEDDAKQRLLDLLQTEFGERYHPRTPAGAAGAADSIATLPRSAASRALDALVLAHHREVRTDIGRALPEVRNAKVREALGSLADRLDDEIRQLANRR